VAAVRFAARPQPRWLATATDVAGAINRAGVTIIDARTAAEIEGTDLRGIKRGGFVPSSYRCTGRTCSIFHSARSRRPTS